MRRLTTGWVRRCGVLTIMGCAWSGAVSAQGSVGSGPLTSTLTETEPTSGVLSMGPVKLAPGITINQIGVDDNVFNESENPKSDFIASGRPDISVFTRLRFLQVSAYGGAELTYFKKFTSERSVGYVGRARVDLLLSRLFPFVGYGETKARERPNSEIDTRADRVQTEVSTGLGFRLSETSAVFVSAARFTTKFEEAFEEGVELAQTLNRRNEDFSVGVRTALTPLTTLTLKGGYSRDLFAGDSSRNADSRQISGTLSFSPQALVSGQATFTMQDFRPDDPAIKSYRGLATSVTLVYPFLEVARLSFSATRGLEYSFDAAEAYFVSTLFNLTYTHRLRGAIDARVGGSRGLSDFSARGEADPRRDTIDTLIGGLGYNLRNRTRVGLSYEYTRRRSPQLALQNYDGRRIFLSWSFAS